jgi:hypothetical protein
VAGGGGQRPRPVTVVGAGPGGRAHPTGRPRGAPAGRGAAPVRPRAVVVPGSRSPGRCPGPDPPSGDRGGGRDRPGRGPPAEWRRSRRRDHRRRPGNRQRRPGPRPGCGVAAGRGLGHRREPGGAGGRPGESGRRRPVRRLPGAFRRGDVVRSAARPFAREAARDRVEPALRDGSGVRRPPHRGPRSRTDGRAGGRPYRPGEPRTARGGRVALAGAGRGARAGAGPHQAAPLRATAEAAGYDAVAVHRDLAGRERVLVARRPGSKDT